MLDSKVSVRRWEVAVDTAVTVTMRKTTPADSAGFVKPGQDWEDFDRLSACIVPTPYFLQSFQWDNGTFTGHFVAPPPIQRPLEQLGDGKAGVEAAVSSKHSLDVQVALCDDQAHKPPNAQPAACRPGARTTVNISTGAGTLGAKQGPARGIVVSPITSDSTDPTAAAAVTNFDAPLPHQINEDYGKSTYVWHFSESPPAVTITLETPIQVNGPLWLAGKTFKRSWVAVSVYAEIIACATLSTVLIASGAIACIRKPLWRRNVGRRQDRVSFRVTSGLRGIALTAAVLVGLAALTIAHHLGTAALVGVSWALVILSVTSSRRMRYCAATGVTILAASLIYADYLSAGGPHDLHRDKLVAEIAQLIFLVTSVAIIAGVYSLIAQFISIVELCRGVTSTNHPFPVAAGSAAAFGAFVFVGSVVTSAIATRGSALANIAGASRDSSWAYIGSAFQQTLIVVLVFAPLVAVAMLSTSWITHFEASRSAAEHLSSSHCCFRPRRSGTKEKRSPFPVAGVIALLLSVGIQGLNLSATTPIVAILLWVVQFAVLWMWLRWICTRTGFFTTKAIREDVWTWPQPGVPRERELLVAGLRHGAQTRGDGSYDSRDAVRLLEIGPGNSALSNARWATACAAFLSIGPVAYLLWTMIQAAIQGGADVFTVAPVVVFVCVATVLVEGAGWVIAGFVFGYMYSRLPCKTGPAKAFVLVGGWWTSAGIAALCARVAGADMVEALAYRAAEFAVFMVVLGVIYDWCTIRAGGGTWRDLRQGYVRINYLQVTAVLAPLLVAVVTLASQISSGAGLQMANTLINGVRGTISAPVATAPGH